MINDVDCVTFKVKNKQEVLKVLESAWLEELIDRVVAYTEKDVLNPAFTEITSDMFSVPSQDEYDCGIVLETEDLLLYSIVLTSGKKANLEIDFLTLEDGSGLEVKVRPMYTYEFSRYDENTSRYFLNLLHCHLNYKDWSYKLC